MKILPIFIPHFGCKNDCVYCDQKTITKVLEPDIHEISERIISFCDNNPNLNKEIAFFGGTFTNLRKGEQQLLFDLIKPVINKISGIRISTRPDVIDQEILDFCKKNCVTTIELGIQSFSDKVLKKSLRGYDQKQAFDSCSLIKRNNFKLGIQLMPGLPDFDQNTIYETIERTITLKPDFVRIYPTIILKNTKLEKWFLEGKYNPLNLEKAIEIVTEMIVKLEAAKIKIIKTGLHSDIEINKITAGPFHPTFGELVRAKIMLANILADFRDDETLIISSSDISLFKGFDNKMLNEMKNAVDLKKIPIVIDRSYPKNKFAFKKIKAEKYW